MKLSKTVWKERSFVNVFSKYRMYYTLYRDGGSFGFGIFDTSKNKDNPKFLFQGKSEYGSGDLILKELGLFMTKGNAKDFGKIINFIHKWDRKDIMR